MELEYDTGTAQALEPTEIRFRLDAPVDNPYDPNEIAVELEIAEPDGGRFRVPGFYARDFEVDHYRRRIEAVGEPGWRVRWTPRQAGEHRVSIRVGRDGGEPAAVEGFAVPVDPAPEDAPGFIRIDTDNPRYFSYGNTGRTFWPMGFNLFHLAWPPFSDYRRGYVSEKSGRVVRPAFFDAIDEHGEVTPEARYRVYEDLMLRLRKTAEAGATALRLRLDSWWQALELYPEAKMAVPEMAGTEERAKELYPVGRYDPFNAWLADELVAYAEKRQMGAILCLWNGQAAAGRHWDFEPYWAPERENADLVRRKIRYAVARWGASPAVWTWEFFNEVSGKQNLPVEIKGPFWTATTAYLRALDPYERPINSGRENIDYIDHHAYPRNNTLDRGNFEHLRGEIERARAPAILGEVGVGLPSLEVQWKDAGGNSFRYFLWRMLTNGGGGLLFWRTERMDAYHLYDRTFRFAREVLDGLDPVRHEWAFPQVDAGDSGMIYHAMRDGDGRVLAYAERTWIDPEVTIRVKKGDADASAKIEAFDPAILSSLWEDRAPTEAGEATLGGMPEGRYAISWNDPATGAVLLEAEADAGDGRLTFPTPAGVTRDAVLRIEPLGAPEE